MLYNMEQDREKIFNIKKYIVDTPPSERDKYIDMVQEAADNGLLYEAVVTDNDTYRVETFKIKADELIRFIQDPYAPRKPIDEKIIISQVH